MKQVAHQAIVMKFILDLAQTLKVDPRGCFRRFFSKIKVGNSPPPHSFNMSANDKDVMWFHCPPQTADKPYQDAFNQELESLQERVRGCAQARMDSAMKELEEEDKRERLGPGGLDPVEVYHSLPKVSTPMLWFWRFSVQSLASGDRMTLWHFLKPYLAANLENFELSYHVRSSSQQEQVGRECGSKLRQPV